MKNKFLILVCIVAGIMIGYSLFSIFGGVQETGTASAKLGYDSVTILTDRDYFPVVREAIANSKESLHLALFELKYYTSKQYKDSNENLLVNELIKAKERGLDVKIIVDEYGNKYGDLDEVINMLRGHGIVIKYDNSKTTTHTKLLIIDNEIVIIGSTNWSHFAIDRNHEASVLIKSEQVAHEFEKYFNDLWGES